MSTGASCYEFRLLCGISRNNIDISDSNEDDVDIGHGSSATAGTNIRRKPHRK
jgi:hypothetical protein